MPEISFLGNRFCRKTGKSENDSGILVNNIDRHERVTMRIGLLNRLKPVHFIFP